MMACSPRPLDQRILAVGFVSVIIVNLFSCTLASTPPSTAPSIALSSLPSAIMGNAYSTTLTATGGTSPYSWSLASGTLPAGLTLSASGAISGTPTTAGSANFTVQVTDSGSPAQTATKTLSISVVAPVVTLSITTSSLPGGTVGTAYSASLSASGGTPGYAWSLASGSLPAGLTLSASGAISGTPTTAGSSSFTVQVSDSGSPAQTATKALSISVVAPVAALSISSSSFSSGTVGSAYSATAAASGGTTPYSWSLSAGTLPPGLGLSAGGTISGTPSSAGTYSFTLKVTDSGSPAQTASKAFSIQVASLPAPPTLSITTSSLAGGTVGVGYSATVSASGGTPGYTWSMPSGSLPPGVTLAATSGTISGTPSSAGTYSFTLKVTDSGSPAQTVSQGFSIVVVASSSSYPTPGPGDLIVFQDDFESGNLNKWDLANSNTSRYAVVSNPVRSGAYALQGTIPSGYSSGELNKWYMPGYNEIYIGFDALFSPGFLNGAGGNGLHLVGIMGNNISNQWSASGQAGIKPTGTDYFLIDPNPETTSQSGSQSSLLMEFYTYWLGMTCPSDYNASTNRDCWGNPIIQSTPQINSNDGQWHHYVYHVKLNTIGLSDGLQEMWIDSQKKISQTGMVWRTSSALMLNQFSIQLYMSTSPQLEYVWFDNVEVWNPASTASALGITTTGVPAGTAGINYSSTLTASGGTPPYSWSVASGALPPGLTLAASTGQIAGLPTVSGTYSFAVQVTDSGSPAQTATQALSMTVAPNPPPVISTTSLPSATQNAAYTATLAATAGVPPYSWSVRSGSLPSGLGLNSVTGVISGTPTATGTSSFTVQVTDSVSQVATQPLSLAIVAAAGSGTGTVIFSDGFESGTISTTNWYKAIGGGVTAVTHTDTGSCHSGNYCAQFKIISCCDNLIWYCGQGQAACTSSNPALPSEYWESHWIKFGSPFSLGVNYFKIDYYRSQGSGSCYYNGQEYSPGGIYLRVICDFTNAPFTTIPLSYDTNWHHLEAHLRAGSSGLFEMWWDGTYIGATSGGQIGVTNFLSFGIYLNGAPTVNPEYLYLDDVEICTGGRCP